MIALYFYIIRNVIRSINFVPDMMRSFLTLIFVLLSNIAFCVSIITGRVVAISDGDTFTILTETKKQVKIRLYGIDCPESKQDFGLKAKQFASTLCFDKIIKAEIKGADRYGRKIAIISLPNGKVLNKELLKAGLAWHYVYYDKSDELEQLEKEARLKKTGLWSTNNFIAPWDFRKNRKYSSIKKPANKTVTKIYLCGASTTSGSLCKNPVKKGQKCWRHKAK